MGILASGGGQLPADGDWWP